MHKNKMLLEATLDRMNRQAMQMAWGQLYGTLQQQALMVSLKELYGWLLFLALCCLLAFAVRESAVRLYKVLHPTYRSIRRFVKHQLRVECQ